MFTEENLCPFTGEPNFEVEPPPDEEMEAELFAAAMELLEGLAEPEGAA